MSVWRVVVCFAMLFAAACGLTACSAVAPQLDAFTHAEPDSTRQRAMRRLSLASAYYEQNQNDVVQQEVRAALRIDPNYADAYRLLGLIHQRAKAPALAQQSFEQALQLASQLIWVPFSTTTVDSCANKTILQKHKPSLAVRCRNWAMPVLTKQTKPLNFVKSVRHPLTHAHAIIEQTPHSFFEA